MPEKEVMQEVTLACPHCGNTTFEDPKVGTEDQKNSVKFKCISCGNETSVDVTMSGQGSGQVKVSQAKISGPASAATQPAGRR